MRTPRVLVPVLVLLLLATAPAPSARSDAGLRSRTGPCAARAQALDGLEAFRAELHRFGPFLRHFLGFFLDRAIQNVGERYADRCVRLNQVQVLGTHNSYHVQPVPVLIDLYLRFDPSAFELEYTHRPLPEQLDLGIRQFELDVFHDPEGGLYADPIGLTLRDGIGARLPALDAPGTKVLHIQDIDWDTRCAFLVECLQQIKAWSDAHPDHLPVFVLIEAKDDLDPLLADLGGAVPLPWDTAAFDVLDEEIRFVFPPEQVITPDDVRGGLASLEQAVLERGWPVLGKARGKVLFGLDNGGAKREAYRAGRPALEGRVLFTNAVPGDVDAAFVKVNAPLGNEALIGDLVAEGYLVRTRADAGTLEARDNDPTRRDAALASGAQYVSTDYPEPDPFDGGYVVELPGGDPGRCNPVNAPAGCRDFALPR